MSAYDTIERETNWWVRVYCEVPMDEDAAVMLSLGDRDAKCLPDDINSIVQYLTPDIAIRLATALLVAAQRAKHQLKVDAVLAGTR